MRNCFFVLVTIAFVFFSCKGTSEEEDQIVSTMTFEKAEKPTFHTSHEPKKKEAPFSDAVQVGNTFYLAGQIGMEHTTRTLVEGGIEAETRKALENIKSVLAHHGLQMADVVKATVILDNIEDFTVFNTIYTDYLPQKPARTTFAAEALALGAKIEIEVVAVKSSQ